MKTRTLSPITVCGHTFETPLGLAAGHVRKPDDLGNLLESECGFIEAGSFTLTPRVGNHGSPYHHGGWYSLNSMGLPNKGIVSAQHELRIMHEKCKNAGKILLGSSAGSTPEEHVKIAEYLYNCVDIIVINLGCPNVWNASGERKPIQGYDPEFIAETLKQLQQELPGVKVLLKVSWLPIADTSKIELYQNLQEKFLSQDLNINMDLNIFPSQEKAQEVVNVIANAKNVAGVIAMNTIGGVTISKLQHVGSNTNEPGGQQVQQEYMISFYTNPKNSADKKHSGGLAGNVIQPFALEQVRMWKEKLPEEKIIIGCGGIQTGADMGEMIDEGADLCQIQSRYLLHQDASIFPEILTECYG